VFTLASNGALAQGVGDDTGKYTVSSPKYGASLIAHYVYPTSVGDFGTSAAWNYSGRWYAEASNNFSEPPHHLVNLSETWTAPNKNTKVTAWAKNLGNVRYDAGINLLAPTGVLSEPGAPRTYGITVSQHF
jgi:iron complex outermembrane receptor protein